MALNGFRADDARALSSFDPVTAGRLFKIIERISRVLRVEVEGIANLPKGRALLVSNHAFGWDVVFLMSRLWRECNRTVWALGEHAWWKFPFLRQIALSVGTVDGTPENVDALLERDQLVLVLPGGLREAMKPRDLRYRLLWGHRYGFVRAAIRHQAPLVPVASIGADDLFDLVGNAFRRGERLLRRPGIPIPLPARILPIPHVKRVDRLRFVIGEPIPPGHPGNPDQEIEMAFVRRLRREVEGALHEIIETELASRVGIDLS